MSDDLLTLVGFSQLTPIQIQVERNIDKNKHIVGLSPTGTGKTHAYLLPIIKRIKPKQGSLSALILVPTNELVMQVFKMLSQIKSNLVVKSYYGSKDLDKEASWLKKNQPDIVILTPAKLKELVLVRRALKIHEVSYFVIDEADMMFDEAFLSLIDQTLANMTIDKFLLFSASITKQMQPFINKYFGQHILIDTTSEHNLLIEQRLIKPTTDRFETLKLVIKHINPYLGLIFVSKKEDAKIVYDKLLDFGLNVCFFSSDLNVKQRKKLISEIHDLKYLYVVASDLASRGIDFDCSHIINYDIPNHLEYFIHRSGRTGRMNKSGIVITIQTEADQSKISKLKNMGIDFVLYSITDEAFKKVVKKDPKGLTADEINQIRKIDTPKKVKPGYKKKHKEKVKEQVKKIKKERYKNAQNR